MAKKEKGTRQKKKKGRSTQELLGIKTFTKYGLAVGKYELLFYMIAPTNISILSRTNIEIKIQKYGRSERQPCMDTSSIICSLPPGITDGRSLQLWRIITIFFIGRTSVS